MAYNGSLDKVPAEYWEYKLVEEHFRGNWLVYWEMPEDWIDMISGFRVAEGQAADIQKKRMNRNYGRPNQ